MPRSTARLDLRGLRKLQQEFGVSLSGGGTGGMARSITKAWGNRALRFWREKFAANSAGGWPPLAASTLKGKGTRKGILRVTDAIYNALTPGSPGNVFQQVGNRIIVGIGGGAMHPTAGMTIARLAKLHNDGGANRPPRPVMPPLDTSAKTSMKDTARLLLSRMVRSLPKPRR